mmetsp:Transcript_25032/g.79588  ORF Transcript_25032/g.79588 Transcript_25032/m.79588 type:complete len:352 (-) Transcript_25032:779-1834(-)
MHHADCRPPPAKVAANQGSHCSVEEWLTPHGAQAAGRYRAGSGAHSASRDAEEVGLLSRLALRSPQQPLGTLLQGLSPVAEAKALQVGILPPLACCASSCAHCLQCSANAGTRGAGLSGCSAAVLPTPPRHGNNVGEGTPLLVLLRLRCLVWRSRLLVRLTAALLGTHDRQDALKKRLADVVALQGQERQLPVLLQRPQQPSGAVVANKVPGKVQLLQEDVALEANNNAVRTNVTDLVLLQIEHLERAIADESQAQASGARVADAVAAKLQLLQGFVLLERLRQRQGAGVRDAVIPDAQHLEAAVPLQAAGKVRQPLVTQVVAAHAELPQAAAAYEGRTQDLRPLLAKAGA